MKRLMWPILLFLMVALTACGGGADGDAPFGNSYFLNVGNITETREFKKVYTGTYSTVYTDKGMNLTNAEASNISDEFDTKIYDTVRSTFADNHDVDGDGKVAIFVYEGSVGTVDSYVSGYFNYVDFYPNSTYSNSNVKDVIYINGAPTNNQPGSNSFNNSLAHQFQHLCNFSYNVTLEHSGDVNYKMSAWMDEGLAEIAGALCYGFSAKQERLTYWQTDPNSKFGDGQVSLTLWENTPENLTLAYAFFAYLYKSNSVIFSNLYNQSGNQTGDVNSVAIGGFETAFKEFVRYIRDVDSSKFPTGFFPAGFAVPTSGTSNPSIKPYTPLYRSTGNFTDNNTELTYLNAAGGVTGTPMTDGVVVTWLNNASWTTELWSDWSSTEPCYAAAAP